MGGDDQGAAALREAFDPALDQGLALGIERRERFVEKQQPGVLETAAGEDQPLSHAGGEAAHLPVGRGFEPDLLEQVGEPPAVRVGVAEFAPEPQRLHRGQPVVEIVVMGDQGQFAAGAGAVLEGPPAADGQFTLRGPPEPRDESEQGRLAGTVGAGEQQALPRFEVEVDVGQGPVKPEPDAQPACVDQLCQG